MLRVKISELKNQLSRYIRAVRAGQQVEVLDRDEPVARLVPVKGAHAAAEGDLSPEDKAFFEEQVRLGIIRPGTGLVPDWILKTPPPGKPGVLAALLEERREGD